MKWTLDNLGDESDSEESGLPQPKEISRASLAAEDFDTQRFLTDHASYRSLQEVQATVRSWEIKLHAELLETVNADFDDFVTSVDSVNAGEPSLEGVRHDIVRFESTARNQVEGFDKLANALNKELQAHEKLAMKESQAQRLLYMYTLLDDLEIAVPEANVTDFNTLVTLSKLYVAMALISQELHDVKAVHVLRISFEGIRSELCKKLDESISKIEEKDMRLQLMEAREHVRAARTQEAL